VTQALSQGAVAPELAAEFPALALLQATVERGSGSSPPEVRARLRDLSDRMRGAQALALRRQPVPWAYRVFFRHIGLDPDHDRVPVEAAALERLLKGSFKSRNLLDDALTIALVETGVALWALDADRVQGALELRAARVGEPVGRAPGALPSVPGRLVVADARGPVAVLFSTPAEGHGVTARTTRMLLYAVRVAGVPDIHVEEAFWLCRSILLGEREAD